MEEKSEVHSIYDYEYLYPNEKEIIKFLDRIYDIPLNESKRWEKEIIDFFKENPFVICFKETNISESEELLECLKSWMQSKNKGVIFLDTSKVFKDLCQIKDSMKINKDLIKKSWEFFFSLSMCLRRMFNKVIDEEDTSFKEYRSSIIPMNYECKTEEGLIFFENYYFLCSDGNLNYDFKDKIEIIKKEWANKLKNKFRKDENKNLRRKNPLDSRLRHECFKRDNYTCKECGATKNEKMLHCDHIIPVSQGGSDELSNLQTLCIDCNLAKSNKCFKAGETNGTTN